MSVKPAPTTASGTGGVVAVMPHGTTPDAPELQLAELRSYFTFNADSSAVLSESLFALTTEVANNS